jgi:hypothetical protein
VVFGYDGSELARAAIAEAGRQLLAHRDALVVTVWSTFNVEFVSEPGTHFDSACADEVRQAAEQTAARGAALAKAAGFHAQAIAVEGTSTWKAIADTADNYDASTSVLNRPWPVGIVPPGGIVHGQPSHRVGYMPELVPACGGCEQAPGAGDGIAAAVRAELRVQVVHVGFDGVR